MEYTDFIGSLENDKPPYGLKAELLALWHDKKGNWDKAHQIVQDEAGKTFAHIHAYLHRKEGDLWNANYWYTRANETMPTLTLEKEWENLVLEFTKE